MNPYQTQTVARAYSTGQGEAARHWITLEVKGRVYGPYRTQTLLSEGDAVIVRGQTAERPQSHNQGFHHV